MNSVSFIFHIIVLEDILQIMNILSTQLQQKSITLGKSVSVINGVIKTLKDKRSDIAFSNMWSNVKLFVELNDVEIYSIGSKRKRQEPSYLQDFCLTTTTSAKYMEIEQTANTIEEHWRIIYFQIIDNLVTNLEKRFSSENFNMAIGIDNFLKLNYNDSTCFINHYKELLNIDVDAIKCEMNVAKNCVLRINQKNEVNLDGIKQVVNREVYPNLFKLIKLALTIPVSSATCERSFSAMRRLKNWLRNSMVQDRFTDSSIIHIERSISNVINFEEILKEYVKSDHKLQL